MDEEITLSDALEMAPTTGAESSSNQSVDKSKLGQEDETSKSMLRQTGDKIKDAARATGTKIKDVARVMKEDAKRLGPQLKQVGLIALKVLYAILQVLLIVAIAVFVMYILNPKPFHHAMRSLRSKCMNKCVKRCKKQCREGFVSQCNSCDHVAGHPGIYNPFTLSHNPIVSDMYSLTAPDHVQLSN